MPWPGRPEVGGTVSVIVDQSRGPLGMNMSGMVLQSVAASSSAMLQECVGLTLTHISDIPVHTEVEASRIMTAERVKPAIKLTFSTPTPPPHSAPMPPQPASTELVIPKGSSGEIGCVFDETILQNVVPGSTADRHGALPFIGHRVSHVNEVPVNSLDEICMAASRTPYEVRLRFGGAPLLPPSSPSANANARALRSITPPRRSPSPGNHPLSDHRERLPPREPLYFNPPQAPAPPPPPPPQVIHVPVAVPVAVPVQMGYPQQQQQQAPQPMTQAAAYELVVDKQPGDGLGLSLVGMKLRDVIVNSPGYAAGAQRFIGMKLTHMNGEPVSSMQTLDGRKNLARVVLRFTDASVEPFEAVIDKRKEEPLGMRLEGMVLMEILPNSASDRAGLVQFQGRQLTHLNGQQVRSTTDVERIYLEHNDGRLVARFNQIPEMQPDLSIPPPGSIVRTRGLIEAKVGNGVDGVVAGQVTTKEGETVALVDFPAPDGRQMVRMRNVDVLTREPHNPNPPYQQQIPTSPQARPLPLQFYSPVPSSTTQMQMAGVTPTLLDTMGYTGAVGDVFESPVRPISPGLHHQQAPLSPGGMHHQVMPLSPGVHPQQMSAAMSPLGMYSHQSGVGPPLSPRGGLGGSVYPRGTL